MRRPHIIMAAAAALAAASSASVSAQDTEVETNRAEPAREDDEDFPWGLLGLLGLAGLLRKKREPDIHVDARHNKR